MANNITRMPRGGPVSAVPRAAVAPQSWSGQPSPQSSGWVWDGTNWVCGPCDDGSAPPFPFCPPPGFPPPGCPPWFSGQNSPPWYPGANAGVSFGSTPPPNPVRGHFWWNGITLFMFDGAVWEPVGGVSGGGQTPPSATAPANPVPGQQWFNGATLFVWDGNAWIPVSQTQTFIQATAPPAPNPGDLWWNGTQFHIWDGSVWELVGPGATVGPVPTTTRVFEFMQSGNLSIAPSSGSVFTTTPFAATPLVDTMNGWDPTLKKYTPTKPGSYMSLITGYCGSVASSTYAQAVLKNDPGSYTMGVTPVEVVSIYDQVGIVTGVILNSFGIAQLNGTTDYLRHWSYSTSGVVNQTFGSPTWSIYLLP